MIAQQPVRVALYIRVSTADQLRGFGLDMQELALRRHVELREPEGWEVPPDGIFIEQRTGSNQNRPAFQRLLADVREKKFDTVLVWKLDRVSRTLNDILDIQKKLNAHGANLASVKERLDFSTPSGRLVFHMFGALAEFERDTIQMRTEEGKRASALAGNYVGGSVPLGYERMKNPSGKGSRLRIVPKEAKLIRQLYEWFLADDLSYAQISHKLNELGVRKGVSARAKFRHKPWREATVKSMLQNEIYRGVYISNRFIKKGGRRVGERPKSEWILSSVDPIVSTLFYAQAQDKINRTYQRRTGGGKTTYMLSRKLVDLVSGKRFVGYLSGKKTKNYRRKKFLDAKGQAQRTVSIAANGLDSFVWKHVAQALSEPQRFLKRYENLQHSDGQRAVLEEKLALFSASTTEARQRCERVERDFYDGRITPKKRDELLGVFDKELAQAAAEEAAVAEQLKSLQNYRQACVDLKQAAKGFKERLDTLTYEEKAKVCAIFVDRVEISETKDERTARAYLRFDPPSTAQAVSEGRTKNPQPEAGKPVSGAKSKVGGECLQFGYRTELCAAYRFEVSATIAVFDEQMGRFMACIKKANYC